MNQPTEAMAFRMREARILAEMEADLDPFDDDTPLVCGIENPDTCESCQ